MTHQRGAAVFDLDGTILAGDSFQAFLGLARRRPGAARRAVEAGLLLLAGRWGGGRAGLKQATLAAVLRGATRAEATALGEAASAFCLERLAKPAALARIAAHRAEGRLLVLATASLDLCAAPLAATLGFDAVLASEVGFDAAGRCDGSLSAGNLRGSAKAKAVAALLASHGIPPGDMVAYSDHQADLPLLRLAGRGIAVDATPTLRLLAPAHGVAMEEWRAIAPG